MALLASAALELDTAPAKEPIVLADVKLHLRVDHDDEDYWITHTITAARVFLENAYKMAMITQTWKMYLDEFPAGTIELPLPPLQSVSSITYEDENGDTQTFASSKWQDDANTKPGRVLFEPDEVWPATEVGRFNAVTIEFKAGYGATARDGATAGSVPASVISALLLIVGHWYEHREAAVAGQIPKEMELAVKSLMAAESIEEAW